jgi:hypothetical protein
MSFEIDEATKIYWEQGLIGLEGIDRTREILGQFESFIEMNGGPQEVSFQMEKDFYTESHSEQQVRDILEGVSDFISNIVPDEIRLGCFLGSGIDPTSIPQELLHLGETTLDQVSLAMDYSPIPLENMREDFINLASDLMPPFVDNIVQQTLETVIPDFKPEYTEGTFAQNSDIYLPPAPYDEFGIREIEFGTGMANSDFVSNEINLPQIETVDFGFQQNYVEPPSYSAPQQDFTYNSGSFGNQEY